MKTEDRVDRLECMLHEVVHDVAVIRSNYVTQADLATFKADIKNDLLAAEARIYVRIQLWMFALLGVQLAILSMLALR